MRRMLGCWRQPAVLLGLVPMCPLLICPTVLRCFGCAMIIALGSICYRSEIPHKEIKELRPSMF